MTTERMRAAYSRMKLFTAALLVFTCFFAVPARVFIWPHSLSVEGGRVVLDRTVWITHRGAWTDEVDRGDGEIVCRDEGASLYARSESSLQSWWIPCPLGPGVYEMRSSWTPLWGIIGFIPATAHTTFVIGPDGYAGPPK